MCTVCIRKGGLTNDAVGVLLLEHREGGDDEAERGHYHEQAGHHRYHLQYTGTNKGTATRGDSLEEVLSDN